MGEKINTKKGRIEALVGSGTFVQDKTTRKKMGG